VREKNGVKLHAVYQSSINAPRQKTQEIVKQACQKAGISIEIKSVTASVFFSSDVANPDTYAHFSTDLQMYTTTMSQPDPGVFMRQFMSTEVSAKSNKYQGRNITRWQNADYDKLHEASDHELDPVKRAAMFIAMNDLVVKNVVIIPVVTRPSVSAVGTKMHVPLSGWDSNFYALYDWYRDA
jgi:peptide/nickel transport system substrate-binding protein